MFDCLLPYVSQPMIIASEDNSVHILLVQSANQQCHDIIVMHLQSDKSHVI